MDIKIEKLEEKNGKYDLDYMFVNELGQFGKYQWIFVPIMCLAVTAGTGYNDFVFSVAKISHRCMIEECGETSSSPFSPDWLVNAVPWTGSSPSSCERYSPVGYNGSLDCCPAELFDNQTIVKCNSHVYKKQNSMVFDFDLGCQEWLRSLAGSMSNIGALLSMPLVGYISDKYGRRIVLVGSILNLGLLGIVKSFSVSYTMFMMMQVIQTTFGYGFASSSQIFVSEIVGPKYRFLGSGVFCSLFHAFGGMLLGLVAWNFQNSWRHLILACNIAILAYGLFYFVLPESIRWLLSQRKYKELDNELRRIARLNGRTINEKSLENFYKYNGRDEVMRSSGQNLLLYVLRSRVLLPRIIVLAFCVISNNIIHKGLQINSTSLSEDMYLNYILVAAVQVPGFVGPAALQNVGRKHILVVCLFLSGVCNAAFVFIPTDMTSLRLTSYLLGMTWISAVQSTIHVYTAEVFPTECRHRLTSLTSMIGRIGSILAPLTPALGTYWSGAPSTLFAACGFLSSLLVVLLPETMGAKMPETLEEAENLER